MPAQPLPQSAAPAQPPPSPAPGSSSEQIERVTTAERAAADIRAGAEAHAQRELEEARRQIDAMTRDRVAMVSQLTEALIEHATLVATQCEGLIRTLEATMQRLGAPAPHEPAPQPAVEAAPPEPPAAPAATATAYPAQGAPQPPPAFEPPPSQHAPSLEPSSRWPGQGAAGPVPPPPQVEPTPPPPAEPVQPPPAPEPAPGAHPPAAPMVGGVSDDAYLRATRLALDGRDRNEIAAQLTAEFGIADPEPVLNRVLGAA